MPGIRERHRWILQAQSIQQSGLRVCRASTTKTTILIRLRTSPSSAGVAAGAFGFLTLVQGFDGPDLVESFFDGEDILGY